MRTAFYVLPNWVPTIVTLIEKLNSVVLNVILTIFSQLLIAEQFLKMAAWPNRYPKSDSIKAAHSYKRHKRSVHSAFAVCLCMWDPLGSHVLSCVDLS